MAWGKAGSTTLGSAGDDLDITSMTANKFNQFLWHKIASSDAVGSMTFNNNANSVYARRRSTNGGTDSTLVSQAAILYDIGDVNDEFVIGYICSISGEEKLILAFHNNRQATGSGSAPSRGEYTAKFVPSPDADITRIDFNNTTGSGSYDTSSNLSALGSDMTPTAAIPFAENVQVGSRAEITDTRKMYNFILADTATYTDDFTSYADQSAADTSWVPTDTAKVRVNVTNDNLAYTAVNDGSNDLVTYDLGSGVVSETKWVLRWKQVISTLTDGGTNQSRFCVGIGDTISGAATNQDIIGMYLGWFNTSPNKFYYTNWANGGRGDTGNGSATSNVPVVGTKYMELARTSASTFEFSISSTSAYTKDVLSAQERTGVTATGLRYIKMFNREGGSGGAQIIGTVDDVEFYNGISSVSTSNTWQEIGT